MQNKISKQHNFAGISFIEILVMLLLISILMSFAIPRFISKRHGAIKKQFFADFSMMVTETAYQAIVKKKIHQVFWDFTNRMITVKQQEDMPEEQNKHKKFKNVSPENFKSNLQIPEQLSIRNFIINGNDEIKSGGKTYDAWFYIMPDGTAQNVIINIEDIDETQANKFSIIINPFYSKATLYDTFQKP